MSPSSSDQQRWNQRYRERSLASFGMEPSEWLRIHENLLKGAAPGRALDLACGNGRNSFYLAELGFTVDALDISDVAIDWLNEEAVNRQAAVQGTVADLHSWEPPAACYQVILTFFYLERSTFPKILRTLAPGGLLLMETFTVDEIEVVGRNMPREYVLEHNELLRAFGELRILDYREGVFREPDKQHERAVARLLGRKEE